MRITPIELGLTALIIGYVAFYTHPVPQFVSMVLSSPVGSIGALVFILLVTVYKSQLVGIFLAIAYLVSVGQVTEYLDPKEQKAEPEAKPQPKSNGVSPADAKGVLKALTSNLGKPAFKGDTKLPSESNKKGMQPSKPAETAVPKATPSKTLEHFASF
jgi:hypothetical protein